MSEPTEATKRVIKYLADHNITAELNVAVNAMCQKEPEDPFGFLSRFLEKRTKAPTVTKVVGREVLDSRGNPTVEADVYAMVRGKEVFVARQAAPSGASTGSNEALELRDADPERYLGKGVQTAVKNVSEALSEAVKGMDVRDLRALDEVLCKTDGDPLKKNLGGNAITAASYALAQAGAQLSEKELFEHFATFFHAEGKEPEKFHLPRPMVNILNGGKHAGGNLKIQEFMIVPKGGIPFREMLRYVATVYHHLSKILVAKYGKSAKNLGDEGGYAPALEDPHETLSLIEEAVKAAGLKVNEDIFLALDCAMSEFYDQETKLYELIAGKHLTSDEVVDYYVQLKKDHPALISIEDGLDEKDYAGWTKLTKTFEEEFKGEEVMIVGDDLYTTNTTLIKKGIAEGWCNALLLKVNQIGSISEAMEAAHMIMDKDQNVIVSHRSGETAGSLIADLAVGIGAQFIKTGATARGERIAKYNRLLQIEEFLEKSGRV